MKSAPSGANAPFLYITSISRGIIAVWDASDSYRAVLAYCEQHILVLDDM